MNVKDAGFFQKHIEKLLLGVGGLILLLCAAYLFLGSPFSVETTLGQDYTPQDLEAQIRQQGQTLEASLQSEDELEQALSGRVVPPYAENFDDHLHAAPLSEFRLATIGMSMPGDFEVEDADPYYVPYPAPPQDMQVASGSAMLADEDALDNPQMYQRLRRAIDRSADGPADFHYVTVSGTFDIDGYYQRYQQSPPSGYARMADSWWQLRRGLGGVYLQRQTWDPEAEQWGQTETIDILPTQVGVIPGQRQWSREEGQRYMQRVMDSQTRVARPSFPPLSEGNRWFAPGEGMDLGAVDPGEVQALLEDRQGHLDRLERDLRLIDRLEEEGGQRQDIRDAEARMDRRGQMILQIEQEIAEMLAIDREVLFGDEDVVARLTGDPPEMQRFDDPWAGEDFDAEDQPGLDGQPVDDGPWAQEEPDRDQADEAMEDLEQDNRIWAHDLTAEPGQTYRYRIVPVVLNPLFDRARLAPEQQRYRRDVVLGPHDEELQSAPWSDEVHIEASTYFFVLGGTSDAAEVELWRFYAGHWRSATFEIAPGEALAGEGTIETPDGEQQVPMDGGAELVSIEGEGANLSITYQANGGETQQRTAAEDQDHDDRRRLQVLSSLTRDLARRLEP